VDARYRFGDFVLNHARGCLQSGDGAELFLRPKSFLLLMVLIDRAGALVSKDELTEAVWPEVIVSDDSVAHCVSDIRKTLGEDGARHIRTVPRRGYMFLPTIAAARSCKKCSVPH
jgi:DNA-binding winged helix-turn-helix (wHTH) protein